MNTFTKYSQNSRFREQFRTINSGIGTSYFYDIKIGMFWCQFSCWETSKNWDMAVLYPKTRRHLLKHMWKLEGGVNPNMPIGGSELEGFTL